MNISKVIGLSLLALIGVTTVHAQDTSETTREVERWLKSQIGKLRAAGREAHRNNELVKAAFRDVIQDANECTVRILSGSKQLALGTVVDPDGYVLTKASELQSPLTCRTHDGRKVDATVVGISTGHDLAMLKIDAYELSPAKWVNSYAPPAVGTWLASAGQTRLPASIGVVSVEPRRIPNEPAVLGVSIDNADNGPQVKDVKPKSGAANAGIQTDDVITHVDGSRVRTSTELIGKLRTYAAGDKVLVTWLRGENEMESSVTLLKRSKLEFHEEDRLAFQNSLGGDLSARRDGFPSALQHDCVLRPEDCGGPLVNLDGEVVGINIARAGRVSSFALPAAEVLKIVASLKSGQLAPARSVRETRLQIARQLEQLEKLVAVWKERLQDSVDALQTIQRKQKQAELLVAKDMDDRRAATALTEAKRKAVEAAEVVERNREQLSKATERIRQLQSKNVLLGRASR